MNKKIALIIVLALLLTSIGIYPPVAQATTYNWSITPPVDIWGSHQGAALYAEWRLAEGTNMSSSHPLTSGRVDSTTTDVRILYNSTTQTVTGGYVMIPWATWEDGNFHTISWSTTTMAAYPFTGTHVIAGGSICLIFKTGGTNVWVPADEYGLYSPLTVSIAGPATAAVGTPTSLGAVIDGGAEPYEEQWIVSTPLGAPLSTGTRSAANVNFLHNYLTTSAYLVTVNVWDSTGATAQATHTINGQAEKPLMHGQLLETGAAGTMLAFGMYTDANSAEGVIPWANCVPTSDYVVTWPDVTITAQYWYQLLTASAYPNPLLVTTRYHEPSTGKDWTYSFSFATTSLTGPGEYIKSDGDSGTIEEAPPTWLQGFLNGFKELLKEIFKWAFVPTDAQMEELMPGGSLGTALLDQTTWGTGSGEWNLTVHAGTIAIPLVDISFATIASWTFVTVIKTGIQAVMCVALVYMIVVLI